MALISVLSTKQKSNKREKKQTMQGKTRKRHSNDVDRLHLGFLKIIATPAPVSTDQSALFVLFNNIISLSSQFNRKWGMGYFLF